MRFIKTLSGYHVNTKHIECINIESCNDEHYHDICLYTNSGSEYTYRRFANEEEAQKALSLFIMDLRNEWSVFSE